MIIFMHKLLDSPLAKASLCLGLLCLEGIIIFQHEGIDKNFFFLLPFVTVYFVNACLRSSFWKSYDLQYLKQMSIASLLFPSYLYRVGLPWLLQPPSLYPDRQLIFGDCLVWQPPLWTSHAVGMREKENKKIASNGEELDKITNQ